MQRLPIPPLSNLSKYLASVKPLLSESQFQHTSTLCMDFINGHGKTLQSRLSQLDAAQKNSWLESLWLDKAYLEYREPSLINSNFWVQFGDYRVIKKPPPKGVVSSTQIDRASNLINLMLQFYLNIPKFLF
jgi:hypothetical protein